VTSDSLMNNEDRLMLAVGVVTLALTMMVVLGDAIVGYLINI